MVRLEALMYLEEIAKNKSISKAADRLFLSKSAVSAAVKNLEKELGVPLLDRSAYGVELTAAGEMVVKKSNVILELVDQMKAECWIYESCCQIEEVVCFMVDSFANNVFPGLVKPLRRISNKARFRTVCTDLNGIVHGVKENITGIGFYLTINDTLDNVVDCDDVDVSLVGSYALQLIAPRYSRHIADNIMEVDMEDIYKLPMIKYDWKEKNDYFAGRYGELKEYILYTDNMNIYCQAIADDVALGMLPWISRLGENISHSMLRVLPIKNAPESHLFLLTNRNCPHELKAKYENMLNSISEK